MKERELREHAVCDICDKKLGETICPDLFYRVSVEYFALNRAAIHRQTGLAMMFNGNAAMAACMGPDEDMASEVMPKQTLTVCHCCGLEINVCEIAIKRGSESMRAEKAKRAAARKALEALLKYGPSTKDDAAWNSAVRALRDELSLLAEHGRQTCEELTAALAAERDAHAELLRCAEAVLFAPERSAHNGKYQVSIDSFCRLRKTLAALRATPPTDAAAQEGGGE